MKELKSLTMSPLVCLRATAIAKWLSFAALLVQLEKEKIRGGGERKKRKKKGRHCLPRKAITWFIIFVG